MSDNLSLEVGNYVDEAFQKLTFDGRKRVKDEGRALTSSDIEETAEPEPFTKENLIRRVIDLLDLEILPEKTFTWADKKRSVDFRLENPDGDKILLEAKPINTDLTKDSSSSATTQIKQIFDLHDAREEYEYGIATDGLEWIIINTEREIVEHLNLEKDPYKLKRILVGEEEPVSEKHQEEITDKFYQWYDALLHGGKYKDHDDETRKISEEDSLVNNIFYAEDEDKPKIAQSVANRLIFIKFLQSKQIIEDDILDYLSDLEEAELNNKMKELFFNVMNRPKDDRVNVSEEFKDIEFLNGSLFKRTEEEERNTDYQVKYEILVEFIEFLDSFAFVSKEKLEDQKAIDPKILGYIFERAMTDAERKSTGAYYTPRSVTKYIAENSVHPALLEKANEYLLEERGYNEEELPETVDELVRKVSSSSLWEIRQKILVKDFNIVDPACGSGAFLLSVANILWNIHKKIDEKTGDDYGDAWMKEIILRNNIFGVDVNKNAVEIARLRLWLWLVDSYDKDSVKPLPNIDNKILHGNSLVGFGDVLKSKSKYDSNGQNGLNSYGGNEEDLDQLLSERNEETKAYIERKGKEAVEARENIEDIDEKLESRIKRYHLRMLEDEGIKMDEEDIDDIGSFHWGIKFSRVFNPDEEEAERGFDVVVGNPPYVRMEEFKELKPYLKKKYETHAERSDLYVYFYERSLDLMSENGYLGYITSNTFIQTGYGENLRRYLQEESEIKSLLNLVETQLFKGVTTYPAILTCKKSSSPDSDNMIKYLKYDELPMEKFRSIVENESYNVRQGDLDPENWLFLSPELMEVKESMVEGATKLEEELDNPLRGIVTGYNKAFIISEEERNELVEKDESSKEILRPFYKGKDLDRWASPKSDRYLIYTTSDTDIDEYPAVKEYLSQFKERLGDRAGKQDWYVLQQPQEKYKPHLESNKIVYGDISSKPKFSLDEEKHYLANSVYFIPSDDLYLLGLLNSRLTQWYISAISRAYRGGFATYRNVYMNELPLIYPSESQQEKVKEKVQTLMELKENSADEEEIESKEHEVDALIFDSYGLTIDQVEKVMDALELDEENKTQIIESFREI